MLARFRKLEKAPIVSAISSAIEFEGTISTTGRSVALCIDGVERLRGAREAAETQLRRGGFAQSGEHD